MATVHSTFSHLEDYFENNLNKDKSLYRNSNDEPTPLKCCREMLDKIPTEFWERDNISILDPCAGFGNFEVILYQILKEKKISTRKILEEIITFNEINQERVDLIKNIFEAENYKLQITQKDFLKYPTHKKYDLQIVNPPYAKFNEIHKFDGTVEYKRASKNHTLVRDFIEKSLEICSVGGYIVYIVPNNWMSLADRNVLIKKLTKYQFHYLDIGTCKRFFPKIGSSFTYFVLEKKPFYQNFPVKCLFHKKIYESMVESQERDFIPLCYNNLVQSITNKVLGGVKKMGIQTTSDLHKYTKKDLIRDKSSDTFKYRLIHTDKQTVYASRPHKFQSGYKVFISTTGNWNVFIDDCGMTQSIAFIRVNSIEEAERIKKILEHPVYRFVNNICRWGNFNCIRILQRMSYPSQEDDIYQSFNITEEEKEFIKNI